MHNDIQYIYSSSANESKVTVSCKTVKSRTVAYHYSVKIHCTETGKPFLPNIMLTNGRFDFRCLF